MTTLQTIQSWPREQLESAFTQREDQLAKALEAEKLARAGFDKAAAERDKLKEREKSALSMAEQIDKKVCEVILERDQLKQGIESLEKQCAAMRDALGRVWDIEEMGYTPDDPESESRVSTCNKCEAVRPNQDHAENCPQPVIEKALSTIAGHNYKSPEEVAAIVEALDKRVAELDAINKHACEDWAEDDTAIRDLCRPFLTEKTCDHDGYAVVPIQDAVKNALESLQTQLTAHTQALKVAKEAIADAIDALLKSYDTQEWPARGRSLQERTAVELRIVFATINNLLK